MTAAPAFDDVPITFIGHPYAPIGMGEQLRSHVSACTRIGLHHRVFDIFRYAQRADAAHFAVIDKLERDDVPGGIRIFHINGDEIDPVIAALEARGGRFRDGTNIIVPAWELPTYPAVWAKQLARFDEVWALSAFIQQSLARAGIASPLIGQSVQMQTGPNLPRRWFGIRESAFALLNFFDLSSYATRKNPEAVRGLFEQIRREQPFLDIQLVLKVKNGERGAEEWAAEFKHDPRIRVIDTPLDTLGVRSLMAACDCFVSLHRAEGFGRGLGEAMALGRLAMGTAWSGNLDFMTETNSLLVRQQQVALQEDEYPHWQGQSWAEPSVEHALELLRPVLADPARGMAMALRGQTDVLRTHSHRAVGVRILARLERIVAAMGQSGASEPRKAPSRRRKAPVVVG
jgi:glycosyltransferase involved in cell wall biosynthesis